MDSAYMSASDLSEAADSDDGGLFVGLYSDIPVDDQKFYFHNIVLDRSTVTFQYSYCNQTRFDSVVVLDEPISVKSMPILFAMGMCVCSWYWMGFYTTDIVVCAEVCRKCNVSDDMMVFWAELYHQTCLEYVYVNHLEYKHINFVLEEPQVNPGVHPNGDSGNVHSPAKYSVLVPMGGGKDSLVVWHEHKSRAQQPPLLLYVADGLDEFHTSRRLQEVIRLTGDKLTLVRHEFNNDNIHRKKRSYLRPCAHPWAALVLFDSLLVARQAGIKEVSFGYERSADEGNGVYVNGCEVNHQYDKSSSFLAHAQEYISRFIDPGVVVKSILHGMWELQISKVFCEAPQLQPFLPVFLSCNEPLQGDWCKRCDKCAFIYLLLSAWLPPCVVMHTVFGGVNMLDDVSLLCVFEKLVGLEGCKPFDCVGTVAEACAALHLTALQYAKIHNTTVCMNVQSIDSGEKMPAVLCQLCQRLGINTSTNNVVSTDANAVLTKWGVHD